MTAADAIRTSNRIDAALSWIGITVRAAAYAIAWTVVGGHDLGRALLVGCLAGDLLGRGGTLPWRQPGERLPAVVDLAVLAVLTALTWPRPGWPIDEAGRALASLAAFGATAMHVGRAASGELDRSRDAD